jgi:hypothetical protein
MVSVAGVAHLAGALQTGLRVAHGRTADALLIREDGIPDHRDLPAEPASQRGFGRSNLKWMRQVADAAGGGVRLATSSAELANKASAIARRQFCSASSARGSGAMTLRVRKNARRALFSGCDGFVGCGEFDSVLSDQLLAS